jgi:hypothetical protein
MLLETMKITIEVPGKELRDAMKFPKAKTKRDAVVQALMDFNRRKRMAELVKYMGTFKSLMTNDEIEGMEIARMKRIFGKFDA